jgi:sulfotransferase family protein
MTVPNFTIIGAAKSGTTALYTYLALHPEIYMSPIKEPNYFSLDYFSENIKNSSTEIERKWWKSSYDRAVKTLDNYTLLFEGVEREKAIGEASPSYLSSPTAAENIQRHNPDIKLIAILRDPAQRAFSRHIQLLRDRKDTPKEFMNILRSNDWRTRMYTSPGFYHKCLLPFINRFPKEQLKIFLYEDLTRDPTTLLLNIFEYLEVSTGFTPDFTKKWNVSGIPRSQLLHKMVWKQPEWVRSIVKPVLSSKAKDKIRTLAHKNLEKPQLDDEAKRHLISIYRDDILQLQDYIDRDLSTWMKV